MTHHRRIIVQHLAETDRELVEATEDLARDRFGERPERIGRHASYVELEQLLGIDPHRRRRSDGYSEILPSPVEAELERLLGDG